MSHLKKKSSFKEKYFFFFFFQSRRLYSLFYHVFTGTSIIIIMLTLNLIKFLNINVVMLLGFVKWATFRLRDHFICELPLVRNNWIQPFELLKINVRPELEMSQCKDFSTFQPAAEIDVLILKVQIKAVFCFIICLTIDFSGSLIMVLYRFYCSLKKLKGLPCSYQESRIKHCCGIIVVEILFTAYSIRIKSFWITRFILWTLHIFFTMQYFFFIHCF